MIKLRNILNEVKVTNPNRTFTLTPEGKIQFEKFVKLQELAIELNIMETIHASNDDKIWAFINLDMMSDTQGESIIKINDINNVDDVMNKYIEKIGGFEKDIKIILNNLIKNKIITRISL